MAKTYFEKLKDPRWQKMRLMVFERDLFTCKECGSKDKMLSVHHGFYTSGRDPWEYPIETLHTVCDDCHEEYESIKHDVHLEIGKMSIAELHKVFHYANDLNDYKDFSNFRDEEGKKEIKYSPVPPTIIKKLS